MNIAKHKVEDRRLVSLRNAPLPYRMLSVKKRSYGDKSNWYALRRHWIKRQGIQRVLGRYYARLAMGSTVGRPRKKWSGHGKMTPYLLPIIRWLNNVAPYNYDRIEECERQNRLTYIARKERGYYGV